MLEQLRRQAVQVWRQVRPTVDERERRKTERRAEGTREIEQLQQNIAREERRERQRRLREESVREIRESCEKYGYWWPPSQR